MWVLTKMGSIMKDHLENLFIFSLDGLTKMRPWERTWLDLLYEIDETGKLPSREDLGRFHMADELVSGGYIEEV